MLTFPYEPFNVQRKQDKQFTFCNPAQKPTGVDIIEEIKPYEHHQKSKIYMKKASLGSNEE
jgi:hypothetical protein